LTLQFGVEAVLKSEVPGVQGIEVVP